MADNPSDDRPLYAQVTIDGYPGGPVWTNPVTGAYQVSFRQAVCTSFMPRPGAAVSCHTRQEASGSLTSNLTLNIGLEADLATCTAPGYQLILERLYPPGGRPGSRQCL